MENVVRVFDGQPNLGLLEYKIDHGKVYVEQGGKRVEVKEFEYDEEDTGYKNGDIVLDEETLLKNIHHIQTESNIHLSNDVVKKLGHCQLDVEMETGTGKTYVYIKTLFELNKRYGWTKFIVVVPSVAIREGVKKSFDITADHFMETYGKKARYFIYNSDSLDDHHLHQFYTANVQQYRYSPALPFRGYGFEFQSVRHACQTKWCAAIGNRWL